MTQFDGKGAKEEIKDLVSRLFMAENHPGSQTTASEILVTDYLPITRGRGQVDRDRDHTLTQIANASKSFHRLVDEAEMNVDLFLEDRVAIARSLLPMINSTTTPPIKELYRNMQVFLKRDDGWRCVAWQVTKVQKAAGVVA